MKDARGFLVFWGISSAVFYFAPFIFIGLVMTGNARLTGFMASIVSGFILTVAQALTVPALDSFKIKFKEEWQWALVYLFVNVLAVWVIARYADLTGVGVASAWVAVFLGVILNLLHWVAWKCIAPTKNKR